MRLGGGGDENTHLRSNVVFAVVRRAWELRQQSQGQEPMEVDCDALAVDDAAALLFGHVSEALTCVVDESYKLVGLLTGLGFTG